jgi:hypothetical protein
MHPKRQERGFALVGAVFALVIIAAMVAGGFFAARQEINIGRSTQTYQRAFDAAEAGLAKRVSLWGTTANFLAVGDSLTYVDTLPNSLGTVTSYVRRLNSELFLIRSVGTSGTSSHVLGGVVKLQLIQTQFKASLTTRSSLKIGGSTLIDGRNTSPSGWGCPPATDTVAAVRTPDSNSISFSGCNNASCLVGNPKIQQDTSVHDSTFFKFGNLTYADLVAMANRTYNGNTGPLNTIGPVAAGGQCTTTVQDNWGEPLHGAGQVSDCYGFFPIIYVSGNLSLTGGRGQGMLLVDGDLKVDGGFEFFGPVIVRGHFETQGTGGHFTGGVMSADVDLELNSVLGNAVITYSSCAITKALQATATGRVMRERYWADLAQ